MSQAGPLSGSGSGPGTTSSFTTDNASVAHPSGGNINIFTSFTSIDRDAGIETMASGSTVTILETNRIVDMVTTVGSTTGSMLNFTLEASPSTYFFTCNIAGKCTADGTGLGWFLICPVRTDGSSATVIGNPIINGNLDSDLAAASIALIASGNNIILQVTGVTAKTINFKTVSTYVVV